MRKSLGTLALIALGALIFQVAATHVGATPPTSPENRRLSCRQVYFEFDDDICRQDQFIALKRVIQYLRANPEAEILVQGHADEQGNATYNMDLSKRRARAVRNYLVNHGIKSSRITQEWKGEEDPAIAGACYGKILELNRRVEFFVSIP